MLLDRITEEIRSGGPIGFDRFMELALYDPDEIGRASCRERV